MRGSPVFQRACEPPPSIRDRVWYSNWIGGSHEATAHHGRAAKSKPHAVTTW